jgi:hypothetical protein
MWLTSASQVKFQTTGPRVVACDSIDEDLDPDIVGLRRLLSLFFDSFDIADMQVPPE